MWKKILKTFVEIALIIFVAYVIITVCNGISFASKNETAPWCVTVYSN